MARRFADCSALLIERTLTIYPSFTDFRKASFSWAATLYKALIRW